MAAGRAARAADSQHCHGEMLQLLWVGGRGCPCWHLWGSPCVSAELGMGDLSKESSGLSLFCCPVDWGSARASTGCFWFPSKSGWVQNKGSHLGNRSCSVCGGCHLSQPTAGKLPSLESEDRSASLAGRTCTDRGAQAEPRPLHLCPPLLVLIAAGSSEKSCWTLFSMNLQEGRQEELGQPCAWQSQGALPSCCLCSKTPRFWHPQTFLY